MTRRAAFWWGVLGSIAPEVLRFFKLLQSGQPLPNLQWIIYALFLFVYMCLAGAVSVVWKPDNELKAIWVGASLPAIIATLVQTAPSFPKR
jgi:hypothetical protein